MQEKFTFSNQYMKFVHDIHASVSNFDEVCLSAREAFKPIIEEFGIAKLELVLVKIKNIKGTKVDSAKDVRIIYEDPSVELADPVSLNFMSRNEDSLTINCYPGSSVKWDESDIITLKFIISNASTAFDRAHMIELLMFAKFHDTMTTIYNADGFIVAGNEIIHKHKAVDYTAFYFNLTNFKYVNKATSYQGGDQALVKYTAHIRKFIEDDEAFGRLGGDNFAVVIKNKNVDEFLKIISNVEISVEERGEVHDFVFGATTGGLKLDETVENMGWVMMAISAAYQIAKEDMHVPLLYCTKEMFLKLVNSKEILMKFPNALAHEEFMVYYQPKVDLRTNILSGAEALVRWNSGGVIIPPDAFVPMLERNGDICKLDFFVFETVCKNIRQWLDMGYNVPVISSNFSRWHLKNENFADNIVKIVDKYNLDHKYIELELTETTSFNEYNSLIEFVKKIKSKGMSVAIDDFGTGYSSLNMLKEVPVDVLKLDKSLIDHSGNSKNDKIMLKHIINLADDMSIKTLAEGVETKEQLEYLGFIGCNLIQGFIFDHPLAAEEFEKRLKYKPYSI